MDLHIDKLACRRGGRTVFAGISVRLRAGDALIVTGRNGAGKSTLLAALAGLLRPSAGTMEVSGVGDRALPECVHHLGHRDGLKGALTTRENLASGAALLGAPGRDPAEALVRVGLPGADEFAVGILSAGQRRRVQLARLLVAHRPLWLLDEPTSALDRDGETILLDMIAEHRASGGIVIAATHAPLPLPRARDLALGRAPVPDREDIAS